VELRSKTDAVRVGYAAVCDRHIPVATRRIVPSYNSELPRKVGFVPNWIHLGFVINSVAMGQV